MDYGEALKMGNLERLKDRREKLCEKLFREIEENEDHKLHGLLPEMKFCSYLQNERKSCSYLQKGCSYLQNN